MRLNIDCVRNILLVIEDQPLGHYLSGAELVEKLPTYSPDDVTYCCIKLHEAGFLSVIHASTLTRSYPQIVEIRDISYQGHQFLENIRKEETWTKVKGAGSKVGSFSLDVLKEIAKQFVLSEIRTLF